MMKTRTYECSAKATKNITLSITSTVEFDESMKIKDVESELREDAAKEFTKDRFKFSAKDIKIKRVA